MIAHLVNFTWKPEATADDITRIAAALDGLRSIDCVASLAHGPDVNMRSGNGDYGVLVIIDGDDPATFLDHPGHVAVARDIVGPHLASRLAVQFNMSATTDAPAALDNAQAPL